MVRRIIPTYQQMLNANSVFNGFGGSIASGTQDVSRADHADNSSPLGRGIPEGIGPLLRKGEIIVDIEQIDGIRRTSKGRLIANFVLGFHYCGGLGYADLVWLKCGNVVVYRNTAPKRAPGSPLRWHRGDQTALDPLIEAAGADVLKTCWPGLAYLVLENFDFTDYVDGTGLPVFTGLISTDATTTAAARAESAITFSDLGTDGTYDNQTIGYDGSQGLVYLQSQGPADYLHTIDIANNIEIRRALLSTTEYFYHIVALPGSPYVVTISLNASNSNLMCARLTDTRNGAIMATLDAVEPSGGGVWEMDAQTAFLARSDTATEYLVFGYSWASTGITPANVDANDGCIMVADITNGTLKYIAHPDTIPLRGSTTQENNATWAVRDNGDGTFTAFFSESGARTIYRIEVSTASIGIAQAVYTTGASMINGLAYDATDDTIVFSRDDGYVIKVDLDGTVQYSKDNSALTYLVINRQDNGNFGNRVMSEVQTGWATAIQANGDPYLVDLRDGSATLINTDDWFTMVFDQDRGFYAIPDFYTGTWGQAGAISRYTLGDLTPGQIDGADILRAIATYKGEYSTGDVVTSGFAGNEVAGLDISSDTTIDALERDTCTMLGARVKHDAGKITYAIPPRDGAYALAATLADSDITIAGMQHTIDDEDSVFERVTIDFIDTGAEYGRNTEEYARPNGEYTVLRSSKRATISTALVMSATQASKIAQRICYESGLDARSIAFTLMQRGFARETGDVVQLPAYGPNDELTIVAEIRQLRLNANFTQSAVATEYLRAIESTFTGANLVQAAVGSAYAGVDFILLDGPLLRLADDLGGAGLRAYGVFTGAGTTNIPLSALWTSGDGYTYAQEAALSGVAPVAGTIAAPDRDTDNEFSVDFTGSLAVTVNAGDPDSLATVSDAAFYRLENYAAIGAPGRWVLIAFRDVSVSGQVATLSHIIWGINGTEPYFASLAAGDTFVRLKPNEVAAFADPASALDATRYVKGGFAGWLVASLPTVKRTADGEAEKPFAPEAESATATATGIDITARVRERLGILPVMSGAQSSGWSEGGLSLEWDIMSGSEVLRTLESTAETVNYPSADVGEDFGTMPPSIDVNIYQISKLGHRGHVKAVSLSVADAELYGLAFSSGFSTGFA